MIFTFLFLIYFTLYNRFQVHPPHQNWLKCIHCYGWIIFYCVYVPQLLYPFICPWTSRLLPCSSYCKWCCNEQWDTCVFFNLGSGIVGSHCGFIPSVLRNIHTVFHSGCINLHSHQQCKCSLFSTPLVILILTPSFNPTSVKNTIVSTISFYLKWYPQRLFLKFYP